MQSICSAGCIAGVVTAGTAVLVTVAAVLCILKRQSKCTYTKFDIHSTYYYRVHVCCVLIWLILTIIIVCLTCVLCNIQLLTKLPTYSEYDEELSSSQD